MARGHKPRGWSVVGGAVHDLTDAEGIDQARDEAKRIDEGTPGGV